MLYNPDLFADKLLTPKEVSVILNKHVSTLAHLRSSGKGNLKYVKIAGSIYYPASQLSSLIYSQI